MAGNRELEQMFLDQTGEEDVEEVMTAQEVLTELQEAWMNEKLAPELLPHKAELVEVMMEQIEQMEENVKALPSGDLRSVIHRQELERIRYLLGSYLRKRLSKVEKFSLYHLHNDRSHLSEQEHLFVRAYSTATLQHLKTVTDRIPLPLGMLNPRDMEMEPDLESHVFARSKLSTDTVMVEDQLGGAEEVSLRVGSQHILPYKSVRELVKQASVILI